MEKKPNGMKSYLETAEAYPKNTLVSERMVAKFLLVKFYVNCILSQEQDAQKKPPSPSERNVSSQFKLDKTRPSHNIRNRHFTLQNGLA